MKTIDQVTFYPESSEYGFKDLSTMSFGFPEPYIIVDPQQKELDEIKDPEFDKQLKLLDRVLDRIEEDKYELKRYIIESMIFDEGDPEAVEIVNQGKLKFGTLEGIIN